MDAIADTSDLSAEMWVQADDATALMKTLSNKVRLMILCLLSDGEKSVADLEDHLQTKQPNVSQQLARLRMEGFVTARRDGRTMFYNLSDERVKSVIEALHGAFCPKNL